MALLFSAGHQFGDSNMDPIGSGTLRVYDNETSNEASIYSDPELSVSLSNPLTLDSSGRLTTNVYVTGGIAYTVAVYDSTPALVWSRDDTWGWYKDLPQVSVEEYGVVGDGSTDDAAALNAAFTASANRTLVFPDGSKTYSFGSQLTIPNGARIIFNGATLQCDYTPSASTVAISGGTDLRLEDLNITISTGEVVDRALNVGARSVVDRLKITSTDQQANTDASTDGAFRITGDDCRASGIHIEDYDRSMCVVSADRVEVEFVYLKNFLRGFYIDDSEYFTLDNFICETASANAATSPGHNGLLISDTQFSQFSNLIVNDAGEHAVRVSGSTAFGGLGFSNIQVARPGQCGMKISGSVRTEDITINGLRVLDCSYGGSASSNEDGLRIQGAEHVTVTGFSVSLRDNAGTGCYDGIYLEDCTDITIHSPMIYDAANHGIHITDGESAVAMQRIYIRGANINTVAGDGIQIDVATTSSTLGDIVISDFFVRAATGYGFEIDSTDTIITQAVIVNGWVKSSGAGTSNEVSSITDTLYVDSFTAVS